MTNPTVASSPLQLDFRDETKRQVIVTGPNEDRFVTTEKQAAAACQLSDDLTKFGEVFRSFLGYVSLWCQRQGADVASCFVSVGIDGVTSFVVVDGGGYRFDLESRLTDFDLEIATRFPDIRGDVLQLPKDAAGDLASFFDPRNAIQVWPPKNPISEKQTTT